MRIWDCIDCAQPLTYEEQYYYDGRCEKCETAWGQRITDWRLGKIVEPELDAMFSVRPRRKE